MAGKIVIAGGSGFVGSALIPRLQESGYEVVVLVRSRTELAGVRSVRWDGRTAGPWTEEFADAVAVINLSGETINQKWTPDARRRILGSRLSTARAIGEAAKAHTKPGFRWVNASAVGFYGDRDEGRLDEGDAPGTGFLAETCVEWEQAVKSAAPDGALVTCLRIGVVLGKDAGALPTLKRVASLGLGGKVGSGKQGVSWIHIDDLVAMILWVLEQEEPPTIVNAVSPRPVSNETLMAEVRKVAKAPIAIPAPAFAVNILGSLAGPDPELVLGGAYVMPRVALDRGFEFKHPELHEALGDLSPDPR